MSAEHALAPFAVAAQAALQDWAGVEAFPAAAQFGPLPAGVTAALELRRVPPGTLFVTLAPATAAALAERVFAEIERPDDPSLIGDCVCELANVVAGHAKALLHGTPLHFNLGVPRLETPPAQDLAVVRLDSELGAVFLGVA